MSKRMVKEMFSPARIALMREVRKHPALLAHLTHVDPKDLATVIAEVATYCDIVVHGMYLPHQLDKMCDQLYFELQSMRRIIVTPNLPTIH